MSASSFAQVCASADHIGQSIRGKFARVLLAFGRTWPFGNDARLNLEARTLVFAPHPDDEVLGCGGAIALKAAAGAKVTVVVMTDGRTSHAEFMDASTLIQTRRAEATNAAARLGLGPHDILFVDFEDGQLGRSAELATSRVVEILKQFEPQEIFVPHRRDRLPDHVATFEIVTSAITECNHPVTLFEYPVWLWNTWPWTDSLSRGGVTLSGGLRLLRDVSELVFGCRTRVDIHSVIERKLQALAEYRSQMERLHGDPRWPILADVSGGTFLACFRTGTEVFRRTRCHESA